MSPEHVMDPVADNTPSWKKLETVRQEHREAEHQFCDLALSEQLNATAIIDYVKARIKQEKALVELLTDPQGLPAQQAHQLPDTYQLLTPETSQWSQCLHDLQYGQYHSAMLCLREEQEYRRKQVGEYFLRLMGRDPGPFGNTPEEWQIALNEAARLAQAFTKAIAFLEKQNLNRA